MNTISPNSASQAILWLNGEASELDRSDVRSFIQSLIDNYRELCQTTSSDSRRERFRGLVECPLPSIRSIAREEGIEVRKALPEEIKEVVKEDLPMDSIMLIDTIFYLSSLRQVRISMSKAQIILYCVYGTYLVTRGERLEIERPQAWKYGPVFPAAFRKSHMNDPDECVCAAAILMKVAPELYDLVKAKTNAMVNTQNYDLDVAHKNPKSPYAVTMKKNHNVMGRPIEDNLIKEYFNFAGRGGDKK